MPAPETQAVLPESERPALVSPGIFRQAMRQLAGACTIITSAVDSGTIEGWTGLAATAVCSVSAEPPRLLVCVNRSVWAHQVIFKSRRLAVNVLSDGQEPIIRRFSGGGVCAPEDKFKSGTWNVMVGGAPLLQDALVGFDCTVAEIFSGSTHDIFICDVHAVNDNGLSRSPLIYFNGQFCSGLSALEQI